MRSQLSVIILVLDLMYLNAFHWISIRLLSDDRTIAAVNAKETSTEKLKKEIINDSNRGGSER